MTRADAAWVAAAAAALALGAGVACWARTPSLAVRAKLALDRALEAMARQAGDRGGEFPAALPADVLPPADPWGRPWRYERAAPAGPVRLWSVGPDGVDARGAGDDVASWTR